MQISVLHGEDRIICGRFERQNVLGKQAVLNIVYMIVGDEIT